MRTLISLEKLNLVLWGTIFTNIHEIGLSLNLMTSLKSLMIDVS